jgi:hypothetical protein
VSDHRAESLTQAFSHLALISAAVNLDYQLDHGAGIMP